MSGFFQVTDAPERRVVQYRRVNAPGAGVVFLDDEAVLGAPLYKVTFRRRVEEAGALKQVPGKMIGGAHRPAQVWRIA